WRSCRFRRAGARPSWRRLPACAACHLQALQHRPPHVGLHVLPRPPGHRDAHPAVRLPLKQAVVRRPHCPLELQPPPFDPVGGAAFLAEGVSGVKIQEKGELRRQSPRGDRVDLTDLLFGQAEPSALVDDARVDKPLADHHGPPRQRGPDDFLHVLSPVGSHQQHLGHRGHGGAFVQQQPPQFAPERGAAGLKGVHRVETLLLEPRHQQPCLGALAAAVGTFKGDKETASFSGHGRQKLSSSHSPSSSMRTGRIRTRRYGSSPTLTDLNCARSASSCCSRRKYGGRGERSTGRRSRRTCWIAASASRSASVSASPPSMRLTRKAWICVRVLLRITWMGTPLRSTSRSFFGILRYCPFRVSTMWAWCGSSVTRTGAPVSAIARSSRLRLTA